jgi:hypothetical protein
MAVGRLAGQREEDIAPAYGTAVERHAARLERA